MPTHRSVARAGLVLAAAVLLCLTFATAGHAQDLRSPDSRDAAEGALGAAPAQDLRSPDTSDAAAGASVAQRTIRPVRVVDFGDNGFDWTDAAVGAGGALGLVLVLGAGGAAVLRRRVDDRRTHTARS
jgi:hypothetical protein